MDSLTISQQEAIQTIIKKGFGWMKFEFEANIGRGHSDNSACRQTMWEALSKEAKAALVFDKVYYDGSVDTEWTFTIPTTAVYLLTEYIEAWNKMCKIYGRGKPDVAGAGFHISILQTPSYPSSKRMPSVKIKNFKQEVSKLLPALLFLASHNHASRGLSYRKPQISSNDKYSAIYTRGDTIMEFRIFETCWDKPEAVFDKVEVIANCLRYYSKRKNKVKMDGNLVFFEGGNGLERFFDTPERLEALNSTLAYLKPKLKTIHQLKRERNFKLDKRAIDKRFRAKIARYAVEYQEQVDRWEQMAKQEIAEFAMEARGENGWIRRLIRKEDEAIKYLVDNGLLPPKPGPIEEYIKGRENGGDMDSDYSDNGRGYRLILNADRRY